MSSVEYVSPLRIELRRSRRLRAWRAAAHGLCLLSLAALQSPGIAAAVVVILGASLARQRHHTRILLWRSDGVWELTDDVGTMRTATLVDVAFVHPELVILPLREPGSAIRRLAIVPDMLDQELFRRLRVRLEVGRGEGSARGARSAST